MGLEKKQELEHVRGAVQMKISLKHRAVMILLAQVSINDFLLLVFTVFSGKRSGAHSGPESSFVWNKATPNGYW